MNNRCRVLARLKLKRACKDNPDLPRSLVLKLLVTYDRRSRLRYDGLVVTEQPTTAKQIMGSLSRYANTDKPADAYAAKEEMEHDRAKELLSEITL